MILRALLYDNNSNKRLGEAPWLRIISRRPGTNLPKAIAAGLSGFLHLNWVSLLCRFLPIEVILSILTVDGLC